MLQNIPGEQKPHHVGFYFASPSNTLLRLHFVQYLTHYRPAMTSGDRKKYFTGSFQFSTVTIYKIYPLWKPEIYIFRHFLKLKTALEKILSISLKLNFTPNTLMDKISGSLFQNHRESGR